MAGVEVFFGAMAGLTFGVPLICAYLWLMFKLGSHIASRTPTSVPLQAGVAGICAAWIVPTAVGLLVPVSPFMKCAMYLTLYLLHAYPTVIGFASARHIRIMEDRARFRKNVDDWLADWECREMESLTEDEIQLLLNDPPSSQNDQN